ncbi:hypothetical protein T03_17449, partial [Trichinella britovi]
LLEPPTLAEAPKLATRIIQVEDDFQERQQPRAGIAKPEKTEMAQKIDAMIREMGNLAKKFGPPQARLSPATDLNPDSACPEQRKRGSPSPGNDGASSYELLIGIFFIDFYDDAFLLI